MHCDECGYDYDSLRRDELAPRITAVADDVATAVGELDDAAARRRPAEGVWSPLEYACHVRDVLVFQDRRIAQAQAEDSPTFAPMNRDVRAVDERYNEQQPATVAGDIGTAAQTLVTRLDALPEDGWQRSGWYGSPNPQLRTVEWVARHTVHELVHHLLDIRRQTGQRP